MVRISYSAVLAFAITTLAIPNPNPNPLSPDPAGAKNVGNGHGAQFIGGACLSAADCASACCATLNGAGICSGPGAQFQSGKQGCGFDSGSSGSSAAPSTSSAAAGSGSSSGGTGTSAAAGTINSALAGSQNVGKGDGSQFITGQCFSDADCASGCCAKPNGVCSGPAVANTAGKTGCGFTVA